MKKIIIKIFIILIIVLIIGGGLFYLLTQGRSFYTSFLANQQNWQNIVRKQQISIENLQKNVIELQENTQQSHILLQQQMQKIKTLEGNKYDHVDNWRALEANYLVRLANDHLQYIHDNLMAVTLLQQAATILQETQDLSLKRLQDTIKTEIARLKATSAMNISDLYSQLTVLNNQIDQLTLRQLQTNFQPTAQSETDLPWWKASWYQFLNKLKKIVIIHYQENKNIPFLLPQEKALFYQNLHAQLQNAIWSVMYQQQSLYDASLSYLIRSIEQYFDLGVIQTQTFLSHLQQLKKYNLQSPTENLNAILQQFDTYFAQQS